MKIRNTLLFLSGIASFHSSADTLWSHVLQTDIKYIYQTIQDNHPGYIDDQNTYFKDWLEQGYKEAMTASKSASSLNDVMTTIQTYIAGFSDGHLYLNLSYQPKTISWAGIQIKKFGNDYRANYVDVNHQEVMPQKMAKLVSCDNIPVENIVNDEVLKYRFNNPKLDFPKVWFAPKVLVDDGIGHRTRFSSCKFEQESEAKEIKLSWKNTHYADYVQHVTNKSLVPDQFSFEQYGDNQYWLRLPKFYPNAEEQEALRSVIARTKLVTKSSAQFVLDVRGNGGGNSEWGVEVARAIYGDDVISQHQQAQPDNSYALWRVSKDNANYLSSIEPMLKQQFGEDSDMYKEFSRLASRMKNALTQGKKLLRQSEESEASSVTNKNVNPIEAANNPKVLLLTDSSCGSACLDFADLMLNIPNVYHIGQETSADTVYMDVRSIDLPSGLGRFSLAQKVYRDRLRAHNQSYKPTFFFDGDINNTEQVVTWVKSLSVN
ncbi:S41 family peptidase [Thalassotalea montiporae]